MSSDSVETAISLDVLRSWQRIVDLLANIIGVPSAVVCKMEPPDYTHYRVLISSHSAGNPFAVDQLFSMEIGTFCETVIKNREPLLVANAREDERWTMAPEIRVGMVSYLGFPVFWPDGRTFGTICVLDDKANRYSELYLELLSHCRDVLQGDLATLTRLRAEIEEQKAQLSELFALVPEAIVMVDRDYRIVRVNPEFTRIFGYTPHEALGRRIADLVASGVPREEIESFGDRMAKGEVFAVETVRWRKDGTEVPVLLTCVPVSANDRENLGYVIYRDITATTTLRDEQRRNHELQLELAHALRVATLGELSASIAHEINQPLTGIIANCGTCARMLAADPPDLGGAREAMRRTARDGTRASDVVARLRALFANNQPAFEAVDLNEAAREVIALSRGELANTRVVLRTELAVALPSVTADRVQLQQVILNLLRNALDAMSTVDDRPRDLLIRTEPVEGGAVRLSVTDAGVGFDARFADKLFQAFHSTKDHGMGIGLSLSRSIIERHRGRLTAALNDGPGATFSFSIPREAVDAPSGAAPFSA